MASAASTGTPASPAVTPAGGFSRARRSSTTRFCSSSGISRMPNARFAVLRSAEMTACEKYGGTAFRSARTWFGLLVFVVRKRSGRDSAGYSSGGPLYPAGSLPLGQLTWAS